MSTSLLPCAAALAPSVCHAPQPFTAYSAQLRCNSRLSTATASSARLRRFSRSSAQPSARSSIIIFASAEGNPQVWDVVTNNNHSSPARSTGEPQLSQQHFVVLTDGLQQTASCVVMQAMPAISLRVAWQLPPSACMISMECSPPAGGFQGVLQHASRRLESP
jgi:hypothetical protein